MCPDRIVIWKSWFFEERGKPEYLEKHLSEQRREPTTNSTHWWLWRQGLNVAHIGGRRVLSPLCHPCFETCCCCFAAHSALGLVTMIVLWVFRLSVRNKEILLEAIRTRHNRRMQGQFLCILVGAALWLCHWKRQPDHWNVSAAWQSWLRRHRAVEPLKHTPPLLF